MQAAYAAVPALRHPSAQALTTILKAFAGAARAGAANAGAPAAEEEDHDQALAELEKVTDGKAKLEGVARLAEQAQPKGSTLDSAGVHTPVNSARNVLMWKRVPLDVQLCAAGSCFDIIHIKHPSF